jgi:hypothetical protein
MHPLMTKEEHPSVRWFHEVKVDGEVAYRAGKRGDHMVAVWPGLGTLVCARDGTAAHFSPAEGATDREVGKLRRAQVSGLLRDLAGQLAVHASAVAIEERAVLFLGGDGAGKSTAAAEMCAHHGARLLADDAAALELSGPRVEVVPSEEDHWLTPQSRAALGIANREGRESDEKYEVHAPRVAEERAPLALVVFLRFDPSLTGAVVRRPEGGDAARWLLEAVIRFDIEDGAARRRELQQLMTLYAGASFLEIARPSASPGGVAPFVLRALKKDPTAHL